MFPGAIPQTSIVNGKSDKGAATPPFAFGTLLRASFDMGNAKLIRRAQAGLLTFALSIGAVLTIAAAMKLFCMVVK